MTQMRTLFWSAEGSLPNRDFRLNTSETNCETFNFSCSGQCPTVTIILQTFVKCFPYGEVLRGGKTSRDDFRELLIRQILQAVRIFLKKSIHQTKCPTMHSPFDVLVLILNLGVFDFFVKRCISDTERWDTNKKQMHP